MWVQKLRKEMEQQGALPATRATRKEMGAAEEQEVARQPSLEETMAWVRAKMKPPPSQAPIRKSTLYVTTSHSQKYSLCEYFTVTYSM